MRWKRLTLTGWGRVLKADTLACRPERRDEAVHALTAPETKPGIIAYGGGRSYGDAALNDGGGTVLTRRLDRFLSFSPDDRLLVCEPGVTFDDILRTFLPRRLLAPVSPGTAFATVGGAVANDVHGKNHDTAGSFGDHVAWIDLALSDGRLVRTSPSEDPELFEATVGGIGLTGLIVAVAFRLVPVPSAHVVLRERRMASIDDFMRSFLEVRSSARYSVGWIDGLTSGGKLGRGVLQTAEYAEEDPAPAGDARAFRLPVDLPKFALNRHSVGLFNQIYYARVPASGRERTVPIAKFLYPLDAILQWNRIYGVSGFHQFQCVVPDEAAARGIPALLEIIAKTRSASFLAVLKTLGPPGRGCLSFPMSGFTLALDFPARPGTVELMRCLERVTLDHGGRIYLAKDSCLTAEGLERMYPRLDQFRRVLRRVDPERRMTSGLARRLNIHGGS